MQPGFYDKDDNLIISWENLDKQGMDSIERDDIYGSDTHIRAFIKKYKAKKIVIPDTITKIGSYTFSGIESVKEVVIPDSVKKIGFQAFYRCIPLNKVNIPEGVKLIEAQSFAGCDFESIEIPSSVKAIRHSAFDSCLNLKKVILNEGLAEIEDFAFNCCYFLKNLVIPNSVYKISHSLVGRADTKFLVSKTLLNKNKEFAYTYKDRITVKKTLDEMIKSGKSFRNINQENLELDNFNK